MNQNINRKFKTRAIEKEKAQHTNTVEKRSKTKAANRRRRRKKMMTKIKIRFTTSKRLLNENTVAFEYLGSCCLAKRFLIYSKNQFIKY